MKEYLDSNNGIHVDQGKSDSLLVCFGGIRQGLGMPVFEFFNSIEDIECDKVFIRDFNQGWYHLGIDKEYPSFDELHSFLKTLINDFNYKNIVFLGNSMGGYAAIMFGALLGIERVLAFAPQTFISPFYRWKYKDLRWKEQLNKVYKQNGKFKLKYDLKKVLKRCSNDSFVYKIYYSPRDNLDRIHAERLNSTDGVILERIDKGGHSVVKILRDSGKLKPLIKNALFK